MKMRIWVPLLAIIIVWALDSSHVWPPPQRAEIKQLSHRGVHRDEMPELERFITQFPDMQFLINLKSNDIHRGEAFLSLINRKPEATNSIFGVYGGKNQTDYVLENTKGMEKYVAVPANYVWILCGWPN